MNVKLPGGEAHVDAVVDAAGAPSEALQAWSWHLMAQMGLVHYPL